MNRDDIIRMADQSEIDPYDMCEDHRVGVHRLMAFAALVAAAEREACAKVCEAQENKVVQRHPARIEFDPNSIMARSCAAAIRARGEQK